MAATQLANRQAMQTEDQLVMGQASSALMRSEMTGEQLGRVATSLRGMTRQEACSEEGLELMRDLDLSSTLLQGVGWMEGDTMVCSSFGGLRAYAVGRPDYLSANGTLFRLDVPIGSQERYVLAQVDNAVVVIHKQLALSFVEDLPGSAITVFAWSTRLPILQRGNIARERLTGPLEEGVFRTSDLTTAIVRSKRFDLGAMMIVPSAHREDFARQTARVMIPIGIASAIAFSILFVNFVRARSSMGAMIRTALQRQRFRLVYQPVIDLRTRRVLGVEALLRWDRGKATPIAPDVFIAVAEQSGLIGAITKRVLELLAQDAPKILSLLPDGHFAVNFSTEDLHRETFESELTAWSDSSGVPLSRLIVEATERAMLDPDRAYALFRRLRAAGVRVAIDDFGTGYSNLSYLATMEIDYLKIDRLFVQTPGTRAATHNVASAIIGMAHELGAQTIAEGIETEAQAEQMLMMGVNYAQGFWIAKPMPLEELSAWLQRHGSETRDQAEAELRTRSGSRARL